MFAQASRKLFQGAKLRINSAFLSEIHHKKLGFRKCTNNSIAKDILDFHHHFRVSQKLGNQVISHPVFGCECIFCCLK